MLLSLRKNGQEEPRLLNLRRLRSSRQEPTEKKGTFTALKRTRNCTQTLSEFSAGGWVPEGDLGVYSGVVFEPSGVSPCIRSSSYARETPQIPLLWRLSLDN